MLLNQTLHRRRWQNAFACILAIFIFCPMIAGSQEISAGEKKSSGQKNLTLENSQVKLSVKIANGELMSDRLETVPDWSEKFGSSQIASIETDADLTGPREILAFG